MEKINRDGYGYEDRSGKEFKVKRALGEGAVKIRLFASTNYVAQYMFYTFTSVRQKVLS